MPVIEISFDFVGLDLDALDKVSREALEFEAFHDEGVRPVFGIRGKYREVLKPGGWEGIGASGRASQSILHRFKKQGNTWEVYESKLNTRKIRTGIPPGRKVAYNTLRKWVMDKGITLYYDNPKDHTIKLRKKKTSTSFKYNKGWFEPDKYKPKRSKYTPDTTKVRSAIYAIRYALYREGTQRPTANWYPWMPRGQGKFNYPLYVWDTDNGYIMGRFEEWSKAIVKVYSKALFGGRT